MADNINVLVVDDSALMRKLVSTMIDGTPGLHVIDTAINGKVALEKIPLVNPDIICLDLEMPEMSGIEFLRERKKRGIHIPVIILSSIAEKGAVVTMEALLLGASDFITKPSGSISVDVVKVKERVAELLLAYGGRYKRVKKPDALIPPMPVASVAPHAPVAAKIVPITKPGRVDVIAIGISTGGPEALRVVFANLDADLKVPILVVQHMPAGFTLEFARSLDKICPLEVKEAEEGEQLVPGRIFIAEGSKHLEVEKSIGVHGIIHLTDSPLVSGHKPSADVLFASVAMAYRNHALGVIMTGMGRDGAAQLGSIYREGGLTLGQDESSAIVYGMPRVAFEMGHVMEQVSLTNMGHRISQVAKASHL
ncbi:MAG: chemotaxis response regulator protein-glutamate methylesterase [Spirochaetaceae bacterium]|jgi:two-component system chemotaxis response regulator CheB|nr:chemotaxis response regulator protein-glutamate methylesterase [Spirochaetaceae bacterium]